MKYTDSVITTDNSVVVRTGNTTVTVNFLGDNLVTVNRDTGGPTEIIKRRAES